MTSLCFISPLPLTHSPFTPSSTFHTFRRTIPTRIKPIRASLHLPSPPKPLVIFKNLAKIFTALSFAALIFTTTTLPTLAASGGGRMGGSYFRSPSPSMRSSPRGFSGGYGPSLGPSIGPNIMVVPGGGYYGGYYGGGPSILGLFAIGAFAATAIAAVRNNGGLLEEEGVRGSVGSVVTMKVGLLANARKLGLELENIARRGDTGSRRGLRMMLEDVCVGLLRAEDYWAYGSVESETGYGEEVEKVFAGRSMRERLKIRQETLANYGGRVRETEKARAREVDYEKAPNEFIVVSLTVAAERLRDMPKVIKETKDLRRVVQKLAEVPTDDLLGCEVVWAPQSVRDVLSKEEMLLDHPELRKL